MQCNHAHTVVQSCTFCIAKLLYAAPNVYMNPLKQSFLLVSTMKKHSDLSFSDDPKVYQMRGRERVEGEYWEKKRVRERERWKCKNKETKKMEI